MSCFPISALKRVISIGSFLSLLIGLITIILAILIIIKSHGILVSSQTKYKNIFTSALAICGLMCIIAGIIGFIGARKKSYIMLIIYSVISILMLIGFAGIGSGLLIVPIN